MLTRRPFFPPLPQMEKAAAAGDLQGSQRRSLPHQAGRPPTAACLSAGSSLNPETGSPPPSRLLQPLLSVLLLVLSLSASAAQGSPLDSSGKTRLPLALPGAPQAPPPHQRSPSSSAPLGAFAAAACSAPAGRSSALPLRSGLLCRLPSPVRAAASRLQLSSSSIRSAARAATARAAAAAAAAAAAGRHREEKAPSSCLLPFKAGAAALLPLEAAAEWLRGLPAAAEETSTAAAAAGGGGRGWQSAAGLAGGLCLRLRQTLGGVKQRLSACSSLRGNQRLLLRLLTGVPLAAAAAGLVLLSPLPAFAAFGWAQSILAFREFNALCTKKKFSVSPLSRSAAIGAAVTAAAATGSSEFHLLAEAAAVCCHLVMSLLSPPGHRTTADVSVSLFGHVWCSFLPSFWVRLRALRFPSLACSQPPAAAAGAAAAAAVGGDGAHARQPNAFLSAAARRFASAAAGARASLLAALGVPWGPRWLVLYGLLLIAANDSVAFFLGSSLGKKGLAALFPLMGGASLPPAAVVSPRKTVVGLLSGAAAAAATGALLSAALGAAAARLAAEKAKRLAASAACGGGEDAFTKGVERKSKTKGEEEEGGGGVASTGFARKCLFAFHPDRQKKSEKRVCLFWLSVFGSLMGLAVSGAAVAGDLLASLLKRDAGVKDSSALLPGHGGWLDRTDAHLLAAPVVFVFGRILQTFLLQLEAAAAAEGKQVKQGFVCIQDGKYCKGPRKMAHKDERTDTRKQQKKRQAGVLGVVHPESS
ncbi:hypothetical protein Efla_007350 [Eimeria flavescens]